MQNGDVFCFQDLNKRLDCRVVGDLRRQEKRMTSLFFVGFLQWIDVKNERLYLTFTTPLMYMGFFKALSNLTLFFF